MGRLQHERRKSMRACLGALGITIPEMLETMRYASGNAPMAWAVLRYREMWSQCALLLSLRRQNLPLSGQDDE